MDTDPRRRDLPVTSTTSSDETWQALITGQQMHAQLQDQARQLAEETERRQRAERQLSAVLDAVAHGILQIDAQGRIQMVNRVLLELFGYQESELLGQPVEILLPRSHKERHAAMRAEFFATDRSDRPYTPDRDFWGLHKNGLLIPLQISLNKIEHNGEPNVVVSLLDISERRRQQKEMLEKTRSLERTNNELRDFAYIATHDLKEPLRGISNYSSFLLEDYEPLLDQEGKDMIYSIVRLAGRMEQFISELLHYSKLGQIDLHIVTTDLNHVVHEAIDVLQPRISANNVQLDIAPLPSMPCDPVLARQLFINLLSNAIKYNDKAEKWVRIGYEARNGRNLLFVQDNGIGISSQFYDRVFKIFKRLHPIDQYEGGTGVGLTIVKKIVERHGGEIWLNSQEQIGTTFYFTLDR